MTSYPSYDRYKDSGVEWLGEIPEHWDVLPGRVTLSLNKEKNAGNIENTVLSLSYGRLVIKPPEKLTGLVPESFEGYQIINPGDLVIRPTDLQNDWTSLRVGLAKNRGIITSAYIGLKHDNKVSSEYLYYLLHSYDLLKVFYGMGSGLRQNLDWNDFKYLPLTLPPKTEQDRIVAFLDEKTAQIDALIAKKQRQIELLDELKAIRINQAVTRGLNPDVQLKDSGVEWIGEIPEHWSEGRLKGSLIEIDKRTSDGTETLLSLRTKLGLVPHDDVSDIQITDQQLIGYKIVEPGELVMNRMRAAFGIFAIAPQHGLVSPDYAVFRREANYDLNYLFRLFKTQALMTEFRRFSKGLGTGESGFLRLYTDRFYGVVCPIPPEEEQRAIVDHINEIEAQYEASQAAIRRQIESHQTLRSTLIAHAVTGRIKV